MLPCGCKPDGMTYGILISAYDKGNQWCLALQVSLPDPSPMSHSRQALCATYTLSMSQDHASERVHKLCTAGSDQCLMIRSVNCNYLVIV